MLTVMHVFSDLASCSQLEAISCHAVRPLLSRTQLAQERAQIGTPKKLLWRSAQHSASVCSSFLPALLQPVVVEEADLDETPKYFIGDDVAPKCASNAIVIVDAIVQTLAPLSARASLNPFARVQLVGTFSARINARDVFPATLFKGMKPRC